MDCTSTLPTVVARLDAQVSTVVSKEHSVCCTCGADIEVVVRISQAWGRREWWRCPGCGVVGRRRIGPQRAERRQAWGG